MARYRKRRPGKQPQQRAGTCLASCPLAAHHFQNTAVQTARVWPCPDLLVRRTPMPQRPKRPCHGVYCIMYHVSCLSACMGTYNPVVRHDAAAAATRPLSVSGCPFRLRTWAHRQRAGNFRRCELTR